jgi:alpha-tubulin suppressor-like RCC1 family protein
MNTLLRLGFFGILFFVITTSITYAQTITPKVQVNYGNSYVLTETGEVYSFGHNEWGELGQGNINRNDIPGPVDLSGMDGKKVWKLGEGMSLTHYLFIAEDSTLYGYGENFQYAMGSSFGTSLNIPAPVNAPALSDQKIIQAINEEHFSFVLTDSGYVYTTGYNDNGYLGLGTTVSPIETFTRIDTAAFNGEKIVKISSSKSHRLFLSENGNVFSVGKNANGQLSTGNIIDQTVPVPIDTASINGKKVIDISASRGGSMIVTEDGSVYTCGNFLNDGLGQGSLTEDVYLFTEVDQTNIAGKTMVQVEMELARGYMLSSDGILFGMGEPGFIKKGGEDVSSTIPMEIMNSSQVEGTIREFYIGGSASAQKDHIVLKTSTGKWYAFGYSERGQTGTGYTTYLETPKPIDVSEVQGDSLVEVAGGRYKTFFVDSDGLLYSSGSDAGPPYTGDGTSSNLKSGRTLTQGVTTPSKIDRSRLTGKTIVDVVAGTKHAFLLTGDGEVFAMGRGAGGQLGTTDSVDVPVPVKIDHSNIGAKKIIKIASGGTDDDKNPQGHTLLLAEDGSVYSFGSNESGQLGLGDRANRRIPTQITAASIASKKIVAIDANGRNSLFIAEDGTVFLNGFGGNGEMGFGDTNDRLVPTEQNHSNLSGVTIVEGVLGTTLSSGLGLHVVLRSDDHRLFSFGEGTDGQLAQGVRSDNYVPTEISTSSYDNRKPLGIDAGNRSVMVRMADGSLYAAGNVHRVGFETSTFTDYSSLTRVEGELKNRFVTDMATFDVFSIALLDDGTVLTFGTNRASSLYYGNLGNGEPKPSDQHTPEEVNNLNVLSLPIPSINLALHLDAGKGFTQSGDTISVWANLADTLDAYESTATFQPKRVDSVINNQPGVLFNGVDNSLTLPSAASLGITNSDYEVFIVARSATVNTEIDFLMAGGGEQFEYHLNGSAGARFIPTTGTYVDQAAIGAYSDSTAHLFNFRATANSAINAVDRALTEVATNAHSSYTGDLFLGKRITGQYFFNGYISEVIVYNSVLSKSDRGRIEDYLITKYGISNKLNSEFTLTGSEGWRLLANPVADSSFAPLLSSIWTQGFTGAKSPDFGSPNVFTWDTASTGGEASNWKALEDIDTPFKPGTGALVYVFSDDNYDEAGDAGFPKTLPVKGIEPLGEQNLTSQLNANKNGWTLLGNPFRYDIRWDAFSKDSLSNAVYVYDNNISNWKTWNGTTGGLTDGKIGAFNGFFVQTMGSDPEIIIPDSSKTYETEEFLGKERAGNQIYSFSLEAKHEDGLANSSWFQFSGEGRPGIDSFDAHKLVPLSAKYVILGSVLNDSTTLDINNLPLNGDPIEIPLQLTTTESGSFTLSKADMNIPEDWQILLIDSQNGESSDLENEYRFTVDQPVAKAAPKDLLITSFPMKVASAAKKDPRFLLKITPGLSTGIEEPDMPKEINLSQNYPNPFNPSTVISYQLPVNSKVELRVFDVLGREVAMLVNERMTPGYHKVTFDAGNLASGMYIYRLKAGNTVITKKLTLIK